MRITVLTMGSRGDVQPYAALARRLMEEGHSVTMATHRRFEWLVSAMGVAVHPLDHEPLKVFSQSLRLTTLKGPGAAWRRARESFMAALDEWDDAVAGADLVVAHPQIFVAPELARRHGARVAFASTLPVSCPTREFPNTFLAGASLGGWGNVLTYRILSAALSAHWMWARHWFARKGVSDLPRHRWDLFHRDGTPVPHLHGISPQVLPRPEDWPPGWEMTGYWRTGPPADWVPDAELHTFLESGPPPVYIGFGSMVNYRDPPGWARDLAHPLLERGERVLMVRGWALGKDHLEGDPRVHVIDEYEGPWHQWLFPRVKAVVHHGGPGTFGAALHAGVPQLCIPFAMDQPFWARRSVALGVAPPPLSRRRWSKHAWAERVGALLEDEGLRARAGALADRLAGEDGVAATVRTLLERAADGPRTAAVAMPDSSAETEASCRVIAFYLPQFHPIPENDAWWGKGFTEWTNVVRARPWFSGHHQPREPGPLGYYDLRDTDVQRTQIRLAREHGVHGFCYHYYWFNGHRLLERPLDQVLADPSLDLPFCVCWANENWTRRWDGKEDDVLISQAYSPEDDLALIAALDPILRDPRYITVGGRPLVVVYRPQLLPDPKATAERWRRYACEQGTAEPYLVNVHSFPDPIDPRTIGFDAAVEFPPHQYPLKDAAPDVEGLHPDFTGRIYDYRACVREAEARLARAWPYPLFPAAMPGWDNTPRRLQDATIFAHATPDEYRRWVTAACRRASRSPEPDERLVFINAWNEWGEGAYLEPDAHWGSAFLQATADGVRKARL